MLAKTNCNNRSREIYNLRLFRMISTTTIFKSTWTTRLIVIVQCFFQIVLIMDKIIKLNLLTTIIIVSIRSKTIQLFTIYFQKKRIII